MAVSCFGSETQNIEISREKQKEAGELSPNFLHSPDRPGPHSPAQRSGEIEKSQILLNDFVVFRFYCAFCCGRAGVLCLLYKHLLRCIVCSVVCVVNET